ncbi:MAG: hypothetical protein WCA12_20875, partial [Burkholderiales bacterium]
TIRGLIAGLESWSRARGCAGRGPPPGYHTAAWRARQIECPEPYLGAEDVHRADIVTCATTAPCRAPAEAGDLATIKPFQSVGTALEDLFAARLAFHRTRRSK